MEKEKASENFLVTARKWRPLKFKDVVGQEHITTTLKNAILNHRIHHAYLFSGPRGVGKTTTARILARALNCTNVVDAEPCNECESCMAILEGKSLDVMEIDGASNNSVDDIRKLRENAKYPPSGKYKLYIIDEVHMLSTSAFNALLKILEEPPPHLMFVFATTEMHKVPATILSRCQRHTFRRMEINEIVHHLKHIADCESLIIDEASLVTIAKKGDGSMRDSQSVFDQVIAFCGMDIKYSEMADALHLVDQDFFFRISKATIEKDTETMLDLASEVMKKGYDMQECLGGLIEHFRNILTVKVTKSTSLIETSSDFLERYKNESDTFSKGDLLRILNILSTTEQNLKFSPQPRIKFELSLILISSIDKSIEISELIEDIKNLKGLYIQTGAASQNSTGLQSNVPLMKEPSNIYSASPEKKGISPNDSDKLLNLTKTLESISQPAKSNDVSAGVLQKGWDLFVTKFANGETGLHGLKTGLVDNITFLNGEIILYTKQGFGFDSLNMKKTKIMQSLAEHFGNRINVKILVSDSSDNTNKQFSQNNLPEQENYSNNSFVATKNNETISNTSNSNNLRIEINQNLNPIEKLIIENFNVRDITR